MKILLSRALVYTQGTFREIDIAIDKGIVVAMEAGIPDLGFDHIYDFSKHYIFPGLADVHVHLREPGFSYKETIATGTMAGARGGYTALCAMPNLVPPPDCVEGIELQLKIIRETAKIAVYPYACITGGGTGRGEPVDFKALSKYAVAFSDDGKGVQERDLMRRAMISAHEQGAIIAAHCEDESLLNGGYIHDGSYAKLKGHRGISSESEWRQVERDLELVRETGCDYHVCHVSTAESVELLRRAKREGLPVSCETAPHYLILCDEDLEEDGRYKMNPPLRSARDQLALIDGIIDGTIDIIATDHAPHSADEKGRGLAESAFGIVGLETALPVLHTELVMEGIITMEKLIELMCVNPRRRFKLGGGEISIGRPADLTVFKSDYGQIIDPETFESMGRATPFMGRTAYGCVRMTIANGELVFAV